MPVTDSVRPSSRRGVRRYVLPCVTMSAGLPDNTNGARLDQLRLVIWERTRRLPAVVRDDNDEDGYMNPWWGGFNVRRGGSRRRNAVVGAGYREYDLEALVGMREAMDWWTKQAEFWDA